MTSRPQFTARQVLDAGLRAESVGQFDHAAQFFAFVLENHGGSQEADAAREHMRRVSGRASEPRTEPPRSERRASAVTAPIEPPTGDPRDPFGGFPPPQSFAPPPGYTNGHAPAQPPWVDAGPSPFAPVPMSADSHAAMAASAAVSALVAPLAPEPRPPENPRGSIPLDPRTVFPPLGSPSAAPPEMAQMAAHAALAAAAQPMVRVTLPHVHLPAPVRAYRTGRLMAGAMIGIGYIAIGTGIGMLGLSIARGVEPMSVVGDLIGIPGAAMLGGLLLLFVGQFARASFDGANASREMVLILRAIADPHSHERNGR